VLRNNNNCNEQLAHTTYCISPRRFWLHWSTPNETCTQLLFYSIRV